MGYIGPVSSVVTISGSTALSLLVPSATQTVVHLSSGITPIATGGAIYTVPAGKTFYCTGVALNCDALEYAAISVDGVQMCGTEINSGIGQTFNGGILFTLGATKSITGIINGGGSHLFYNVWGFIQ